MSLVTVFAANDCALICADTRVSYTAENISYQVRDDYTKIRMFNNNIVFLSGLLENCLNIFNRITDDMSHDQIVSTAKEMVKQQTSEIGGIIVSMSNNKLRCTQFSKVSSNDKLTVEDTYLKNGKMKIYGANQEKASAYMLTNQTKHRDDFLQNIRNMYDHVADELVGGKLTCFFLKDEQIGYAEYIINDSKPLKKWNSDLLNYAHADLNGKVKAIDATIKGDITMNSGSISWSQVNKPNYTANEVGAVDVESPMLTHIDAHGIYTGTVNANQINAGKIHADRIDVDSLHVNKLYNNTNNKNYATVGGNFSDLALHWNETEYYKVYNNADGSITFLCYGTPFMTVRGADVHFHGEATGVVAVFG